MFFHHIHFNFFDNTLTLFCWLMVFAHWLTSLLLTSLLLTPFAQTWYHKRLFLWGGCVISGLSEGWILSRSLQMCYFFLP
jgi:hypothetical protein